MGRQLEPGTRLNCEQCGAAFEPKNRNGVIPRFCADACRHAWKNAQRLKGAAFLKDKAARPKRRQTKALRDNATAQYIALHLIPAADRPALLAQAAENLGLVETPVLTAARQTRRICDRLISAGRDPRSCFKPLDQIRRLAGQPLTAVDGVLSMPAIERTLKHEAMLGVLEAAVSRAAVFAPTMEAV